MSPDEFHPATATAPACIDGEDPGQQGKQVFVDGTPTLFVNGKRIENALEFTEVSAAIESALAK